MIKISKQLLITILILLNIFVVQSKAEVLEEYESKFYWKAYALACGVGPMYILENRSIETAMQMTFFGASIILPKPKIGFGIKYAYTSGSATPKDYMIGTNGINLFYLYYLLSCGISDKVVYGRESGEAALVERRIKPLYLYFGIHPSYFYSGSCDAGICWAPVGFVKDRKSVV